MKLEYVMHEHERVTKFIFVIYKNSYGIKGITYIYYQTDETNTFVTFYRKNIF